METAQRRPDPFGRLIAVTLAAATLIAAIGLLAANDTDRIARDRRQRDDQHPR